MKYLIRLVIVLICTTSVLSCSSFLNTIVKKQQWSENYALAEGVEANDPAFIDGDLETVGLSRFPVVEMTFQFPLSEAVVILPEKKNIHRIVVHTTNMQVFDVMARQENGGWEKIKEVKGNSKEVIDLRLNHVSITDGIKIRVRRTSHDAGERRKNIKRIENWIIYQGNIRSSALINEIKLYGYVDEQIKSQEPDKAGSDEVEDLLTE